MMLSPYEELQEEAFEKACRALKVDSRLPFLSFPVDREKFMDVLNKEIELAVDKRNKTDGDPSVVPKSPPPYLVARLIALINQSSYVNDGRPGFGTLKVVGYKSAEEAIDSYNGNMAEWEKHDCWRWLAHFTSKNDDNRRIMKGLVALCADIR